MFVGSCGYLRETLKTLIDFQNMYSDKACQVDKYKPRKIQNLALDLHKLYTLQ